LLLCLIAGAAGVGVLAFGRIGKVRGPRVRLYMTTSRARGVGPGTDVWLAGVRVGAVQWVKFQPPTNDTARRLVIAFDVAARARPRLRRDTRASIEPGTSRIGAPVVQLTGGTVRAPLVADGDTLASIPQSDVVGVRAQLAQAAQDLPIVLNNFTAVRTQIFSPTGTIGAMGQGQDGRRFMQLRSATAQLAARATGRRGTLALMGDSDVVSRARLMIARADSLAQAASGPRSAVHEWQHDSAFVGRLRDTRSAIADVETRFGSSNTSTPRGEAAEVRQQLGHADTLLTRLLGDIGRRPLRYMNF
jgi:phospholipid/cholesterol/gamma-HCH transport system substrate-binding protein